MKTLTVAIAVLVLVGCTKSNTSHKVVSVKVTPVQAAPAQQLARSFDFEPVTITGKVPGRSFHFEPVTIVVKPTSASEMALLGR